MSASDAIKGVLDGLSPDERARLQPRLERLMTHRAAIRRFPTPGHLGQLVRPGWLQTPMLDAIDDAIMQAEAGVQTRWVINTPPQEGKSSRLQDAGAWLLIRKPWLRIAYASYEQGIAAQSGLAIRQMLETHGSGYQGQAPNPDRVDVLGLMLDPNRAMQTSWSLADVPGMKSARKGGVISVGIGSAFTGRPVDVLIVDDPLKDARAADSPVIRKAAIDWFQSVATTRLAPGAIVIIVQTRWHEEDLSGWVLTDDSTRAQQRYRHLNIPAQAEAANEAGGCECRDCLGQPDILGRQPGEYLLSARGRTVAEWEQTKQDVGTRWWFALYQGRPSPPEGGIFQRAWFDRHRVATTDVPELVYTITMVDPADNDGDGDEAGIITGGIDADGEIYILEDNSGNYTIAGWIREATFALIRHKSSRLAYERSLSGLNRAVLAEWKLLRKQSRALLAAADIVHEEEFAFEEWPPEADWLVLNAVVDDMADPEDTEIERQILWRQLAALWPYVPAIMEMPVAGPYVKRINAEGSKSYRASMVSPTYEQGRVHHAGRFTKLEHQLATWLPTQDSPDRMDTVVHLVRELSAIRGVSHIHKPVAAGPAPARQQRVPALMRSTRR